MSIGAKVSYGNRAAGECGSYYVQLCWLPIKVSGLSLPIAAALADLVSEELIPARWNEIGGRKAVLHPVVARFTEWVETADLKVAEQPR
jgi:hypothetical protein